VIAARAAGLAAIALLAPAAAAEAGPPGSWTRVAGGVPSGVDVGVARDPSGALHLLWPRASASGGSEQTSGGSVLHNSLSAGARRLGGERQVAAYDGGVNHSVALVPAAAGVRAFFSGLQAGGPLDRVLATASFGRGRWSAAVPVSNASSGRNPYAAAGIGAAVAADGTPVTVWGSPGSGLHVGLDPGAPDGSFAAGNATGPGVGVDSSTGQALVAWNVLDAGTVAALPVPPSGPRVAVPGARAAELQHRVGVSGRIGAPGVYVAYLLGGNQFSGRPALWRFGAPRGRPVSSARGARDVSLAAAPGGRLWVFWHRDGRLYATRSDPRATRFGAPARLAPPRGLAIEDLAGEGSRGPLDMVAVLSRPRSGAGIWHQRVLPELTLTATRARRGRVTLRVTDAGVPVRGARVRVEGVPERRSGRRGTAAFRLAPGSYRARATRRGYAPASLRVRVR
jgi:hypothetical protein